MFINPSGAAQAKWSWENVVCNSYKRPIKNSFRIFATLILKIWNNSLYCIILEYLRYETFWEKDDSILYLSLTHWFVELKFLTMTTLIYINFYFYISLFDIRAYFTRKLHDVFWKVTRIFRRRLIAPKMSTFSSFWGWPLNNAFYTVLNFFYILITLISVNEFIYV